MADENVRYDLDNYKYISKALWDLVNTYPDLGNEAFSFAEVDSEEGNAFIPTSGAVIINEINDVTGHTIQECVYPFTLVSRAGGLSENNKLKIKEWLDSLGKWLERQPVTVGNNVYQIETYPELTGDREIKKIERTQPCYLSEVGEDNVETWVISLQATYRNEFDR